MDPINPIAGNPEALNPNPPTPTPTKDNHGITIAALAVFILLALGAVAFLYYQNQQLKSMLASYQAPTPTPTATTDPTVNWETYKNTLLAFEIKYPPTIQVDKELNDQYNRATIFKGTDLRFEVMLRNSKNIIFDSYYYMDSPIKRRVTLDGHPANVYEFPNGICDGPSCTEPSIAIVAENGSDLYHLIFSGDVQLSEVENQILSTFKFTGSSTSSPTAKPVACTMEAKICPDGSSVGRTGPNCEFAPCPSP